MTLSAPLAGKLTVTSRFGKRPQVPGTKADTTNHLGTDLRAAVGTPCLAPADGVVYAFRQAGRYSGPRIFTSSLAGNWIVLWHPSLGIYVNYAHMQGVDVALGQQVSTGQQVGRTGNTGGVAPHLHAGVWTRIGNTWTAHDPESFFDFTGKATTPAITDKGFLMALTDDEQADLYSRVKAIRGDQVAVVAGTEQSRAEMTLQQVNKVVDMLGVINGLADVIKASADDADALAKALVEPGPQGWSWAERIRSVAYTLEQRKQ